MSFFPFGYGLRSFSNAVISRDYEHGMVDECMV